MARQKTAIVIGAGVIGVTTAYALARRGWLVTLVDKEAGAGLGASHANGAQLSYCYTDALASPALLKMLPKTLLGGDGLKVTWSANLAFARWIASFARNCTRSRFTENTLAALALAQKSQTAMIELLNDHPIEFGQRTAGKLHLYFTQHELENARAAMALKRSVGCDQIELSVGQIIAAEPGLSGLSHSIAGAISTPSEEVGDAYAFCRGLLGVLEQSFGVQTVFGHAVTTVKNVETDKATVQFAEGQELEANMVVLCAASASGGLAKKAGINLPILPMKGYSFEMPIGDNSPRFSITDTKHRIVMANLGDRLRVAGFADLGNWDSSIDPRVSRHLVEVARQSFPDAGDYNRVTNQWAGLRPMTPNSRPIISRPKRSLAINAGQGMLGWTLAMGSAEALAETIAEK